MLTAMYRQDGGFRSARRLMFDLSLHRGHHVRRYLITADPKVGWEITVQNDERLQVSQATDWHRVERAIKTFETEASRLVTVGWRVAPGVCVSDR